MVDQNIYMRGCVVDKQHLKSGSISRRFRVFDFIISKEEKAVSQIYVDGNGTNNFNAK